MDQLTLGVIFVFSVAVFGSLLISVAPLVVLLRWLGPLRQRPLISATIVYLASMAVVGLLVYALIPAQYARDLDFSSGVRSSSLGEIHAVYLQRVTNPEAVALENTPAILNMVHEDRAEFFRRWIAVTLAGQGVVLIALVGLKWRKALDARRLS